jgi:hypothetical protein
VSVRERHLERVKRQVDVSAVLVAAWSQVPLNEFGGMLCEGAAVISCACPVTVGDLGDDLSAFLQGFEDHPDVELRAQRALDSDLDVVEVDENGNLQSCICQNLCIYLRGLTQPIAHYGSERGLTRNYFARTSYAYTLF